MKYPHEVYDSKKMVEQCLSVDSYRNTMAEHCFNVDNYRNMMTEQCFSFDNNHLLLNS